MVQQFSDDPAAKNYGGVTNWLEQGKANKRYPESVVNTVFAAEDKTKVYGPIEHNDWVYFVQLLEKRGGAAATFEQSKGRIAKQMERARRLERYDGYVAGLKSEDIQIVTHPDKVKEQVAEQSKSNGPPTGPVSLGR
jgi:hypothetical protein